MVCSAMSNIQIGWKERGNSSFHIKLKSCVDALRDGPVYRYNSFLRRGEEEVEGGRGTGRRNRFPLTAGVSIPPVLEDR